MFYTFNSLSQDTGKWSDGVGVDMRQWVHSSPESCPWSEGWKAPSLSHLRAYDLYFLLFPSTHSCGFVSSWNVVTYEPASYHSLSWLYLHSAIWLTKKKTKTSIFRDDDRIRLNPDCPQDVAVVPSGPQRLFLLHVVSAQKSLFYQTPPRRKTKAQSFCSFPLSAQLLICVLPFDQQQMGKGEWERGVNK